jgi:hypothetical protein
MDYSVARLWDEAILDAIRRDTPRPPVHARNLFHMSVAMYDAWAAYDTTAKGYIVEEHHTAPDIEAAREEAISYAAYRVLSNRYAPGLAVGYAASQADFTALMNTLGYDPSITTTVGSTPAALGNRIGASVIAFGMTDGSNQAGNYGDYTNWFPVNDPLVVRLPGNELNDPNAWQQLALEVSITQNGLQAGSLQGNVGTNWLYYNAFAIDRPQAGTPYTDMRNSPPPALMGSEELKNNIIDALYKASVHDATVGVGSTVIDISPGAIYNNPLGTNDGTGYAVNPYTGQPYEPEMVKLADYARVLAEFWADGPSSETPPGHWNSLANEASDHPLMVKKIGGVGPIVNDLEWDVKMYFSLNAAVSDAATAAWSLKRYYDSPRPISMIRYMATKGQSSDPELPSYHPHGLPLVPGLIELITAENSAPGEHLEHLAAYIGKIAVFTWPGAPADPVNDASGVKWILGENWSTYQRTTFVTPPFAGYVSGHSTFSRSAAETLTQFTGTPYWPGGLGKFEVPEGSLDFEYGPTQDFELQWATYYDAADQAGISRIYGGIHPYMDDFEGRILGHHVGLATYALASDYWEGTVVQPALKSGGDYVLQDGSSLTLRASVDSTLNASTMEWDLNNDNIFGDVLGGTSTVSWATLSSFGITSGNTHLLRARANDGLGGPYTTVDTWLSVFNTKPTANAGGPYTLEIGQSLTLNASASFDPIDALTYSWDVNGDGVFGDATGVNPTLTPAQLDALGVYGSPRSFSVAVQVDDGKPAGKVTSASVPLSVYSATPVTFDVNSASSSINVTASYTTVGNPSQPLLLQTGSLGSINLDGSLNTKIASSHISFQGSSSVIASNQVGAFAPGGTSANAAFESSVSSIIAAALRNLSLDLTGGPKTLTGINGQFSPTNLGISFNTGSVLDWDYSGSVQQSLLSSIGTLANTATATATLATVGFDWQLTIPIAFSFTVTGTGGETITISASGQIVATADLPGFNDVAEAVLPLAGDPRAYPGGGAAGDYDNDGYVDIFVTRRDAQANLALSNEPFQSVLFRNKGDGTFEDRTVAAGLNLPMFANGASWADVNNDGYLDLYVTSWYDSDDSRSWRYYLFMNDGDGTFTEQAVARGVDLTRTNLRFGEGISFGDFDRDGYLDLAVAEWTSGGNEATNGPYTRLFRNLGAANPGYFEDVTVSAGVSIDDVPVRREGVWGYSPRFADMDNDGWSDLLIVSDFGGSRLFWNNGDGTFTDGTLAAGVGNEEFGMGNAVADVNGDGLLDWLVTSIYTLPAISFGQGNRLHINNGDRTFTDASALAGVADADWAWGAEFVDVNNDGLPDLVVTNGYDDFDEYEGEITDPGLLELLGADFNHFRTDQTQLFLNMGGGFFSPVSSDYGITDTSTSRGVVTFDYNNDGRVDVAVLGHTSRPILYRNNVETGNDWLSIRLHGTASNSFGIGSKIYVYESPLDLTPKVVEVSASSNYRGQSDSRAHFGLGTSGGSIHKVEIRWASGVVQTLTNVTANQILDITETPDVVVPASVDEGGSLVLDGSAHVDLDGPALTFTWDLNNDGTYGDAVGANPTVSWSTLESLGLGDGPDSTLVRLRVLTASGAIAASSAHTLSIVNVAPMAAIVGPSSALRGESLSFTLSATDLSSIDASSLFTFEVDWNDGSALETFVVTSGTVVTHTYALEGTYLIQVTATDKDGGESLAVTYSQSVDIWALRPNASNSLLTDLVWHGTPGSDWKGFKQVAPGEIVISTFGEDPNVGETVTGVTGIVVIKGFADDDVFGLHDLPGAEIETGDGNDGVALFHGTSGVYDVDLGAGNDIFYVVDGSGMTITVDCGADDDIFLHLSLGLNSTTVLCGSGNDAIGGGMGSDYFDGGSGRDLLIGDVHGGTGNDTILGGLGDDLIIGGAGANQIDGGAGSDLIIAGSIQQSIYFEGESGPSGIFQIYQVWLSDDPVDDRVAKIRGQQPSSIDPASYLIVGSTIINDIAIDVVLAGDDEDYIFADVGEDSTPDYNVLEDELIDIGS